MRTDVETLTLANPIHNIAGIDLLICLAFVFMADGVLFLLPPEAVALRTLFGLPLLFFVPGYAFLAALFPGDLVSPATDGGREARSPPSDHVRRVGYAFGMSVALLPILALALQVGGVPITLPTVLSSLTLIVLAGLGVGAVRRNRLPAEQRYQLPLGDWVAQIGDDFFGGSRWTTAGNALVAVAMAAALVVVLASIVTPISGEAYTSFALLTETESGDLVAGGYPTDLAAGEELSLVVSVENHERQSVEYSVVIVLQRVATDGGSAEVIGQRELDRFGTTLGAGEQWQRQTAVTPTMTGDDLRLTYLLYRGDAPAEPIAETAYRDLHLWLSVGSEG